MVIAGDICVSILFGTLNRNDGSRILHPLHPLRHLTLEEEIPARMAADVVVMKVVAAVKVAEINNTLCSVCLRHFRRSLSSPLLCFPGYRPSLGYQTAP